MTDKEAVEPLRPKNEEVLNASEKKEGRPMDDKIKVTENVHHIVKKAVPKDQDPDGLGSDEKMRQNHEEGANW